MCCYFLPTAQQVETARTCTGLLDQCWRQAAGSTRVAAVVHSLWVWWAGCSLEPVVVSGDGEVRFLVCLAGRERMYQGLRMAGVPEG